MTSVSLQQITAYPLSKRSLVRVKKRYSITEGCIVCPFNEILDKIKND